MRASSFVLVAIQWLNRLSRPALKKANVGFSMGIAGTEVAKEASDIVLMDDNFASIVTAIVWGRCVNDSVRKFLQFQLSVNIVAVLTTFITAISSADEESVLTAVQLLWVNLIMDTFAALALATDPATRESLKRKPDRLSAPLISVNMWKMITGQSTYQLTVALVLHFAGPKIFKTHSDNPVIQLERERQLSTLIFNQFVFCQIFNQFNARILDRGYNIFHGIHRNLWFIGIFCIMTGGQVLIVFVGGAGSWHALLLRVGLKLSSSFQRCSHSCSLLGHFGRHWSHLLAHRCPHSPHSQRSLRLCL
jgi:Ca2+-transporting ATPase